MWDQPAYTYLVSAEHLHKLSDLETRVPGVLLYGRVRGRLVRVEKANAAARRSMNWLEIRVPFNAAWLVERTLAGAAAPCADYWSSNTHGITFWSEDQRPALEALGRTQVAELVASDLVRGHVSDLITPYQAIGVAWTLQRPWAMFVWACGSGKTCGALLAALSRPGPILVVCPAKARHVWWSQVQEYSTVKPYRLRPESGRRKNELTLEEYLAECEETDTRPFVIVGSEALPDNVNRVRRIHPSVLIIDEIHTHGSHKRWRAIQQADGGVSFERKMTAASQDSDSMTRREVRACAIMDVSRMTSLKLRIGLSASPLDDGRTRGLWAPFDLLVPGGFSHSYGKYAIRFCDARPGPFGGLDDKGSSNMDELKARSSCFLHEVPYSESHAALPSTRVQVIYLDRTELCRAERYSDQQTFGQALKAMVKEEKKGPSPLVKERMIEARLAEACSRKRRYVIDEAIEGMRGGGKVVIFTARRRETEIWAEALTKATRKGDMAVGAVPVWMAHGGVSERDRDEMVDQFRSASSSCCLVATGQSIGTGVDGLQTADLALFAMLPWKPGDFIQWKGRFDRLGGSPTLLKVVVATGTYDEKVVDILVNKFGPIEQMLVADELKGLGTKLHGLEDTESLVSSIIDKLEIT